MSRLRREPSQLVNVLLGVGYIVVACALVAAAVLAYNRTFVDSVDVKLTTESVGNALQKGSDVKLHGVPVGTVTSVRASDGGAVLTLALNPATSKTLPRDTIARLLPKTLFGERYVSLITPAATSPTGLSTGDTITQDTSNEAIELEDVFDQLLPLLQSIQPEKLAAMMSELTTMLHGQGRDIGDTLVTWSQYVKKFSPLVPAMADDLDRLTSVAATYNVAVPDLLSALDSMTTTSKTLVAKQTDLKDLFAGVILAGDTTTAWLDDQQNRIEVLSSESRLALQAVAPYASQFPCLLEATRKFIPVMDKTLGVGTKEPGIHVKLNVVPSRGKYLPGEDAPVYASGGRARCPYVTGQTGTQPVSSGSRTSSAAAGRPPAIPAPPSSFVRSQLAASSGLGDTNSPAENKLLAELLAPTQAMAPADYPTWSSLLVGPTLRNTKVTLR